MTTDGPTGAVAFVYGTLTDPERVAELVDEFDRRGEAVLDGLHVAEGRYPTLVPGGSARGRLLWVDDLGAVDAYEGVDRGLYVRVAVPLAAENGGDVWTYVGDPDRLGVDETVPWPGEGPFRDRVSTYVRESDVRVRRVE